MTGSASEFGKDLGLMHEVTVTGRKVGFTPQDWGNLAHSEEIMRLVLLISRGQAKVEIIDIVDLAEAPFMPEEWVKDGWKIEKHMGDGKVKIERRGDDLFVDGKKIEPFLSKKQTGGKSIDGNKLRKELESKMPLNANILDYLLQNPNLIPDSWKKDERGNTRYTFFWGTIYRGSDGGLCVRCLCWGGGRWVWGGRWLGGGWSSSGPAAALASS